MAAQSGYRADRSATKTRSRFAASCNGIRRRRSISGSAFMGRRINPTNRACTCCSHIRRAAVAPAIPADTSRYATGWALNPAFAKLIGISAELEARARQQQRRRRSDRQYRFRRRQTHQHYRLQQAHPARICGLGCDAIRRFGRILQQRSRRVLPGVASGGEHTGPSAGWPASSTRTKIFARISIPTSPIGLAALRCTTYEQVANPLGVFAQGNYQITDTPQGDARRARGSREPRTDRTQHRVSARGALVDRRRSGRIDHIEPAFRQGGAGLQARLQHAALCKHQPRRQVRRLHRAQHRRLRRRRIRSSRKSSRPTRSA